IRTRRFKFHDCPSGVCRGDPGAPGCRPRVSSTGEGRDKSPLHTAYGVARCGIDFALRHRMMFRMRSVALAAEYPTIPSVGYPTIPAVRSSADRIATMRPFTLALFSRRLFDAASRLEV